MNFFKLWVHADFIEAGSRLTLRAAELEVFANIFEIFQVESKILKPLGRCSHQNQLSSRRGLLCGLTATANSNWPIILSAMLLVSKLARMRRVRFLGSFNIGETGHLTERFADGYRPMLAPLHSITFSNVSFKQYRGAGKLGISTS